MLRYQHVEQDQPVEIHPGVLRPVDYSQPHHIQIRAYQHLSLGISVGILLGLSILSFLTLKHKPS